MIRHSTDGGKAEVVDNKQVRRAKGIPGRPNRLSSVRTGGTPHLDPPADSIFKDRPKKGESAYNAGRGPEPVGEPRGGGGHWADHAERHGVAMTDNTDPY